MRKLPTAELPTKAQLVSRRQKKKPRQELSRLAIPNDATPEERAKMERCLKQADAITECTA